MREVRFERMTKAELARVKGVTDALVGEYPVRIGDRRFSTVSEAFQAARPGDLVLVSQNVRADLDPLLWDDPRLFWDPEG